MLGTGNNDSSGQPLKPSLSAKRCPHCGKVTDLYAADCGRCGHRFRTQFEEPERTQAFDAVLLPRLPAQPLRPVARPPARTGPAFAFAFGVSFCLVAVLGLLTWLTWAAGQPPVPARPHPVTYAASQQPGRAEDLYERVGLSMSLYDLDQAAGGMGRVIRTSDPHLLLLAYDFPSQSVHVSLSRSDLSSTDYRVDAVALYRGNTLLQRHVEN